MTALPKQRYTIEEYIALEKGARERYEYFDGEVFCMAGASLRHTRISANAFRRISDKISGRNCEAFSTEARIKVPTAPPYRYPDASVVCGEVKTEMFRGQEMVVNPILLVEVLSPSTSAYDLHDKFLEYQSIDTFEEYLVISQEAPQITQYIRQADHKWLRMDTVDMDGEITLESLDITLTVAEIYERVSFPAPASAHEPPPPASGGQ
ncbi:MAG: Uma2 family endonuclease [Blastocatellia bacterium]